MMEQTKLHEDLYFALNFSTDVIGEVDALRKLTTVLRDGEMEREATLTAFSAILSTTQQKLMELNAFYGVCMNAEWRRTYLRPV